VSFGASHVRFVLQSSSFPLEETFGLTEAASIPSLDCHSQEIEGCLEAHPRDDVVEKVKINDGPSPDSILFDGILKLLLTQPGSKMILNFVKLLNRFTDLKALQRVHQHFENLANRLERYGKAKLLRAGFVLRIQALPLLRWAQGCVAHALQDLTNLQNIGKVKVGPVAVDSAEPSRDCEAAVRVSRESQGPLKTVVQCCHNRLTPTVDYSMFRAVSMHAIPEGSENCCLPGPSSLSCVPGGPWLSSWCLPA
jgi:hypothetical protein